jgi:hypothetical protein
MPRDQPHGRDRDKAMKTTLVGLSSATLAVILLIAFQGASGAVPITTGSTPPLGNTLPRGTTSYTVFYSYPSIAQVGTNLTMALTLHINSLSGIVQYISNYNLQARVFIGAHEVDGIIGSETGAPSLYAGSSWGPNNVTIPLTADNTGLAKGESANATVGIVFNDFVFYGAPINAFEPENQMQGQGGSLTIENDVATSSTSSGGRGSGSGGVQSILPYALVGSGVVLMVAAIYLTRSPRQANP